MKQRTSSPPEARKEAAPMQGKKPEPERSIQILLREYALDRGKWVSRTTGKDAPDWANEELEKYRRRVEMPEIRGED